MLQEALWIGGGEEDGTCPEFVKEFCINKGVKSARMAVTAIGVYEAHINGRRVGDFVLAPGCTAYHKRLQYQTYDVTDMLGQNNRLSVTVGTGWHRNRMCEGRPEIRQKPCALIAALEIEYADGTGERILTDSSWRVQKSRILMSDLYDGELYNAALPEAEASPVTVLALSKDILIPQEGEKVCEHERLKPARLFVSPKGERIVDFGQNLTGYVEFCIEAAENTRIRFSHAEILDSDGNFYTENYRSAKAGVEYICKEGKQTYKPHFTFFGFRYIRLDEFPERINLDDFTAIAVYSDIVRTGNIECGNQKVNQLFSNTLWSQKDNFLDIPTDCPQRDERQGWTGDAQVFAKTACYNYHVKRFFEKWLGDMRAEQREDGSVPDMIPNFWNGTRSSAAWGDAVTIIPWQLYMIYGDVKTLADNFDAMKKWVDYITGDSLQKYLWICADSEKGLWGKHYGDWLALDAPAGSYVGSSSIDFIASAFYARSTELLVKAGKVLGRDMTAYEELYRNIVAAFKRTFPVLTTQTEHTLALYFNLTDDKQAAAKALDAMIKENGNKLQTGFVGTPYLLHALSENGYSGTAYDLLLQEGYPSWLYEVSHGATTIWEHWDGVREDGTFWSSDMNSYNHYAYGSVMDWIYTAAAGIRPAVAGFREAVIAPVPEKRLGWLDVSLETAYGRIASKWTFKDNGIRYEIHTPVPAAVIIGGKEYRVQKGSYIFYE